MGAGIAREFRTRWGRPADLVDQHPSVGRAAYIIRDERFIFYLVTKRFFYEKPTYYTMAEALKDLSRICNENRISTLLIPQLGCGLDKLEWGKVKRLIEEHLGTLDVKVYIKK